MNFERGKNIKDTLEIGKRKEAIHISSIDVQATLLDPLPWNPEVFRSTPLGKKTIAVSGMRFFLNDLCQNKIRIQTFYEMWPEFKKLRKGEGIINFELQFLIKCKLVLGKSGFRQIKDLRATGIIWMDDYFFIPEADKSKPLQLFIGAL